jgi:hypothetical protein
MAKKANPVAFAWKARQAGAIPAVLYHVTKTSNVLKIRKKGILRLQPSNWVEARSGQRYGEGEVFAFEVLGDAVRWAARWDWGLTTSFGSGKVSIVEFLAGDGEWTEDTADPIGQAGNEGRWLKSPRAVKPQQIVSVAVFRGFPNQP